MPRVTDQHGAEQPDDLHVERGDRILGADERPQPRAGTSMLPADVPSNPDEDVKNPLSEEVIKVRVKPGVEFFFQGDPVKEGDEFDMPVSMARNAAMYVDHVTADGLRAIPHASQRIGEIPRANLAGRPRHERIGALEDELKQLDERRMRVASQLDHEVEIEKHANDAKNIPTTGVINEPATRSTSVRDGESGRLAEPPKGKFAEPPPR
jgi:hypothetical protein